MRTLRKINRSDILLNLSKRILKAKLIIVLSEYEGSSYHIVTWTLSNTRPQNSYSDLTWNGKYLKEFFLYQNDSNIFLRGTS